MLVCVQPQCTTFKRDQSLLVQRYTPTPGVLWGPPPSRSVLTVLCGVKFAPRRISTQVSESRGKLPYLARGAGVGGNGGNGGSVQQQSETNQSGYGNSGKTIRACLLRHCQLITTHITFEWCRARVTKCLTSLTILFLQRPRHRRQTPMAAMVAMACTTRQISRPMLLSARAATAATAGLCSSSRRRTRVARAIQARPFGFTCCLHCRLVAVLSGHLDKHRDGGPWSRIGLVVSGKKLFKCSTLPGMWDVRR